MQVLLSHMSSTIDTGLSESVGDVTYPHSCVHPGINALKRTKSQSTNVRFHCRAYAPMSALSGSAVAVERESSLHVPYAVVE